MHICLLNHFEVLFFPIFFLYYWTSNLFFFLLFLHFISPFSTHIIILYYSLCFVLFSFSFSIFYIILYSFLCFLFYSYKCILCCSKSFFSYFHQSRWKFLLLCVFWFFHGPPCGPIKSTFMISSLFSMGYYCNTTKNT